MTKEIEFETYLSISQNELEIYLFDTINLKNIYEKKLKLENVSNNESLNILSKFLEENIFIIEKSIGQFIKNIYLILNHKNVSNIEIGIKKKNYEKILKKNFFKVLLIDIKDLFKESYTNKKIMHMLVKRILVNDQYHSVYEENIKGDYICLEIEFKSIGKEFSSEINKIFEKYQIEVLRYIDREYLEKFFKNDVSELPYKAHKIINGYNFNEVELIPKNVSKTGFFEKFFQLFS
tara:strand:+ start:589 stop:1293 length:705 start_codon:yes stop_codon:yes gene_type:complete